MLIEKKCSHNNNTFHNYVTHKMTSSKQVLNRTMARIKCMAINVKYIMATATTKNHDIIFLYIVIPGEGIGVPNEFSGCSLPVLMSYFFKIS